MLTIIVLEMSPNPFISLIGPNFGSNFWAQYWLDFLVPILGKLFGPNFGPTFLGQLCGPILGKLFGPNFGPTFWAISEVNPDDRPKPLTACHFYG